MAPKKLAPVAGEILLEELLDPLGISQCYAVSKPGG